MPETEAAQVGLLSPDDPVEDAPASTPLAINRSRRGWPRGYQPPPEARSLIKASSRTSLARSIVTALGDLGALLALSLAGAAAYAVLPLPAAIAVSIAAVLVIGRFGRAQECLVHEASHRNWQRNGRWNDLLANLLAGFPTASQVGSYRRSHVIHHAHLGCAEDPDIQRYEEFNLEELTGLSGTELAKGVARRLPRYNWGWYTTIGTNPITLALTGTWFLAVFAVVASLTSPSFAAVAWAHWLLGYTLVLPTIRMIGEAGEHRYSKGDTVFNSTISNLGWAQRWIIHPHGDGHHTLHHLWSSVPHYRIRETHLALADIDTDTYASQIFWRAKVLENVRQGLPFALSITLSIAEEVTARHPEVLVGGFVATGLVAASAAVEVDGDTAAALEQRGLRVETIAADPLIADWRAAIAACGLKPSTFKSSPEQLARRVLKSGPLHTPLALVDLYCDVATRHLAPMGAYDLALLPEPSVALRLARPDTDAFHPLGARDDEMPLTPKVAVYASGDTVICWAYNCRDSRDTCLQEDTDAGLFIGEAVAARQHEPLRSALSDLAARLEAAGAVVGPVTFADAAAPTVVVNS